MNDEKKAYHSPEITDLGAVADLTQTGLTNPGSDAKDGSRPSQGA